MRSAPKFAKSKSATNPLKEQESLLLNVWTQERSFQVLGALVVTLLFFFVVVIGPP